MMTTAATSPRPPAAVPGVRSAAVITSLVALCLLIPALLSDPAAFNAVLLGIGLVLGFFVLSTVTVNFVATHLPAASLLVAMLTYGLFVLLLAAVFIGLRNSGAMDSDINAGWLGGTIIVLALTWTFAQLLAAVRVRQPLYDLSDAGPDQGQGSPGGEADR